jgi:cytochrome c peroxidase
MKSSVLKLSHIRLAGIFSGSLLVSTLLSSCGGGGGDGDNAVVVAPEPPFVSVVFGDCGSGMPVELPCDFPIPREEEDNRLSVEKIELGRLLFYDRNMSFNQTQSCGDCHLPEKAFTDGLTVSIGSEGHMHPRNAMSMTNVVYNTTMNWANNVIVNLDQQSLAVLLNDDPIELGWTTDMRANEILGRLMSPDTADYTGTNFASAAPDYPTLFANAFPDATDKITLDTVNKALAAFGSTMISGDSEFDKEQRGEPNTMTEEAKRGRDLFFTERLECFHCHGGFNFSGPVDHAGNVFTQAPFHNNGLYSIGCFDPVADKAACDAGAFPPDNPGLAEFTLLPADIGRFRAPTLRNIALTAPYMHDGSIATLDEMIDHYARGGTLTAVGPNAGDGALNSNKSSFINGFVITPQERVDLLAFFDSLTDWDFLCRDSLNDPFGVIPKHGMCP